MKLTDRDPRLNSPGHFVGLKWREGWWFIQVLGNSVEELKPWVLLNENGNRAAIASDTTGDQDDILDENNRRQLEPNDDERNLIYQILVGVEPSRMAILPLFGRDQNIGLEDSIQGGDDEVWITGFDSPYNNPSGQSEVFYVNDMTPLKFQAHNPMGVSDEAKLSFFVNKLRYATVTNINLMKGMLQNQITSSKHMMGLGAADRHQLNAPEWVTDIFGEHIKDTETILRDGDTSQIGQAGQQVQSNTSTELQRTTPGGRRSV